MLLHNVPILYNEPCSLETLKILTPFVNMENECAVYKNHFACINSQNFPSSRFFVDEDNYVRLQDTFYRSSGSYL